METDGKNISERGEARQLRLFGDLSGLVTDEWTRVQVGKGFEETCQVLESDGKISPNAEKSVNYGSLKTCQVLFFR